MVDFQVFILGSASATPIFNRRPTAQVVAYRHVKILVDCGEGTQMQFEQFKIKRSDINYILISHLHGDHFYGLLGLLASFNLGGRKEALHVYGPPELAQLLELDLVMTKGSRNYPLHFYPINPSKPQLLFTFGGLSVSAFPVKHSVSCTGFIFEEVYPKRKLISQSIQENEVPVKHFQKLLLGKDVFGDDNKIYTSADYTKIVQKPRKYVFSADTTACDDNLAFFNEANLLYHEATFLHAHVERAAQTFHSTALQAAQQAQKANVQALIIGHFSARYKQLDAHLIEAKSVFHQTQLAIEGAKFPVV